VIERLYEQQAAGWIELARSPHDSYWFYRDFFFELVPEPGARTLEIGCGEGRVARDLRGRGHSLVAIDAAPTLVASAAEADPGGDYRVADAGDLPFADGSFDLVVSYNSLMDVDDMPRAVSEAGRVLQPGGRFCVCVTHPVNDAGRFESIEPGAPFLMRVYRGRRRYDEWFERRGVKIRFVSWCYPLEDYARALEDAGLLIEAFREPAADRSSVAPHGERRLRIPNFLMIRAAKAA
jgi:ubiquinone/menaquinone biosynthesis C-methylase UbiE